MLELICPTVGQNCTEVYVEFDEKENKGKISKGSESVEIGKNEFCNILDNCGFDLDDYEHFNTLDVSNSKDLSAHEYVEMMSKRFFND